MWEIFEAGVKGIMDRLLALVRESDDEKVVVQCLIGML